MMTPEEFRAVMEKIPCGPRKNASHSQRAFNDLLREIGELSRTKQRDHGKPGDPFANVRSSADLGMPAW